MAGDSKHLVRTRNGTSELCPSDVAFIFVIRNSQALALLNAVYTIYKDYIGKSIIISRFFLGKEKYTEKKVYWCRTQVGISSKIQ